MWILGICMKNYSSGSVSGLYYCYVTVMVFIDAIISL